MLFVMELKKPVSCQVSMETDQLISMIHFLVKREEERAQENQELTEQREQCELVQRLPSRERSRHSQLKDMVRNLRDTHKQDVKTQTNLMKSIDKLTNQVADLTTQNRGLQQKVNDMLSQISTSTT